MDISAFSGGYIGVDVFFVISGYLITQLIQRDLDTGTFSLLHFWERRARRILPALVVVVAVSVVAGWFLLLPYDYEALMESVSAQAVFGSNVYFWFQSGYFDEPSSLKPLLHTWSLAVEEQFYLFFPALLLGLAAIGVQRWAVVVAGLALLSFVLNVATVSVWPDATFFLAPARAWELLIGALAAQFSLPLKRWIAEFVSLMGLGLILISSMTLNQSTVFPGWFAVAPCLGAVLFINANQPRLTFAGKILATKPFVFVGLISYSLYLWHWPVLVFTKYTLFDSITPLVIGAVVLFSFLAAVLSWRFVEQPFRRRIILSDRSTVFAGAVASLALFGLIGWQGIKTEGFPSRFDNLSAAAQIEDDWQPYQFDCFQKSSDVCVFGADSKRSDPEVVVWGDSHSQAVLPVLKEMAQDREVSFAYFGSDCPSILNVDRFGSSVSCHDFAQSVKAYIDAQQVNHVLLVSRWSMYVLGVPRHERNAFGDRHIAEVGSLERSTQNSQAVFQRRLPLTVNEFQQQGVQVWILKQVPNHPFLPRLAIQQALARDIPISALGVTLDEYQQRHNFVNTVIDNTLELGARVLDPTPLLCATSGRRCQFYSGGQSLYRDEDHLSAYGSFVLEPLFAELMTAASEITKSPTD